MFGDQNGALRQLHGTLRHPQDQLEHALADVGQIRRTLSQQRFTQAFEEPGGRHRGRIPGKGRALAFGQQAMGLFKQGRVFKQFLVGAEDLGLGAAGRRRRAGRGFPRAAPTARRGGAHGVSLINTINSIMGVDPYTLTMSPSTGGKGSHGGYCGPAVKPIALNMVAEIARDPETAGLPISGIGGIFLRARDPQKLAAWYQQYLGVSIDAGQTYGCLVAKAEDMTVWSTFSQDTDYFGSRQQQCMVNYRVTDLDAMLAQLRAGGAVVDDKIQDEDYGRFGWATDPEGNRFELWQPK